MAISFYLLVWYEIQTIYNPHQKDILEQYQINRLTLHQLCIYFFLLLSSGGRQGVTGKRAKLQVFLDDMWWKQVPRLLTYVIKSSSKQVSKVFYVAEYDFSPTVIHDNTFHS